VRLPPPGKGPCTSFLRIQETTMNKETRILVIDDHPIVRDGLEHLLSRESDLLICGQAEDAEAGLKALEETSPDLVIVDISLQDGISGLELTKIITEKYPELPILVLSMHDEALYAERVIRSGARGYIMKQEMTGTIVDAIRMVMEGRVYLSERMKTRLIDEKIHQNTKRVQNPVERLSNRELEVLRLIGQGMKTSEIAEKLKVATKTIDTHRYRLKNKLDLKSGAELVKFAVEWNNSN